LRGPARRRQADEAGISPRRCFLRLVYLPLTFPDFNHRVHAPVQQVISIATRNIVRLACDQAVVDHTTRLVEEVASIDGIARTAEQRMAAENIHHNTLHW
jgi:hypothetical protein